MLSRKDFLLSIIREIGTFQMEHFGKEIEFETKGHHMDFVSFVDTTSQKMFTEKLGELFPHDVVFGEEDHDPNHDYSKENHCWIIDPVDGTVLFKKGLPLFGVMIGYIEAGNIQLSSILLPALDDLYFADSTGAYRNGERIHVSHVDTLAHSLLNMTSYSIRNFFGDREMPYFSLLRNIGSIIDPYSVAFSATSTARGSTEGGVFYPNWGNVWDTIPGAFLVQQAGGKVTTIGKDYWNIWDNKMLYSNGLIHEELQKNLDK